MSNKIDILLVGSSIVKRWNNLYIKKSKNYKFRYEWIFNIKYD